MATAAEKFRRLLDKDDRYDKEVYNFAFEALDYTLKNSANRGGDMNRHISPKELLGGMREYAIGEFGLLARTVLESWGVRSTNDFGNVVFNLIENCLMGKQLNDRRVDFRDFYDFDKAFDVVPVLLYNIKRNEFKVIYLQRDVYGKKKSLR